ncbi:uncharacterized protein MYCFIDRAFT_177749 [Pseudocercospora fijiensis CIRAD86]|uniref:DUF7025 domain-containing protein n=1 Tax=Pseudocercospora fijiensis (strain CIRAD86) TaxID=383855 RepID=M3A359_PSEFD|nr:uncharacterized protein MYCFIDRAFT_177749 [Pseudocercospora fijiensis CIRAD86]EME79081.1 hypothetical protein MYCFIDRAFT_177749 [Pseudocercospora fijiensis CIRAD86]
MHPTLRKSFDDETEHADVPSPTGKREDTASKHSVRIVTSRLDIKSGNRKGYGEPTTPQEQGSGDQLEQAVLLRKVLDDRDLHGEIEIYDSALKDLLHDLLRHYPRHWAVDGTEDFKSPYEPLILNWDLLWAESGKECKDEMPTRAKARQCLRQLLSAILQGSGDAKLDSYLEAHQSLRKQKHITFQALWTIFPPGALVWTQLFAGTDQILVVSGPKSRPWPREGGSLRSSQRVTWALNCMAYDFDGNAFRRKEVTIHFDVFESIKPMASLAACPLALLEISRRDDIKARLLKRGKLFRRYCAVDGNDNMYTYTGSALVKKQVSSGTRSDDDYTVSTLSLTREQSDSDSGSAFRRSPFSSSSGRRQEPLFFKKRRCHGRLPIIFPIFEDAIEDRNSRHLGIANETLKQRLRIHYDQVEKGTDFSEWDEVQLMMCPPRVLGYALREHSLTFKQVMDKLHFDGADSGLKTKELLSQLVKNHRAAKDVERGSQNYEVDNIVAEKGKGLVFLLYGSPAEYSVRTNDRTRREEAVDLHFPILLMYVISLGQELLTKSLSSDEADVFLQSRLEIKKHTPTPTKPDTTYTVFLRFLEYYRGILFLTTNQIAQFDCTWPSNPTISKWVQTIRIFMDFIDQYHNRGVVGNYGAIKEYAEEELHTKKFDGRQIRNIVSIAMEGGVVYDSVGD